MYRDFPVLSELSHLRSLLSGLREHETMSLPVAKVIFL